MSLLIPKGGAVVTIVDGHDAAPGSRLGTVRSPTPEATAPPATGAADAESREWLRCLHADGEVREAALARLHDLLLRAARFEVRRRQATLSHVRGAELEDIACQAADDAMISVLARLDDFRGLSRFTTWAYKFALLEAAVKLRRRAWQEREVLLEPDAWSVVSSPRLGPDDWTEHGELLATLQDAIATILTPHQRRVLVALALEGVPIDLLAERLNTTRGALYKALHDARRKLRQHVAQTGLAPSGWPSGVT